MTRIITAAFYVGLILTLYGALWGSITNFGIGIAIAVGAWVIDACRQDLEEVGEYERS